MKKKILILGVASVQDDAIQKLHNLGYETYACAMADDGPGSKEADHFEIINILDIEKIIQYINENKINCVYSVGSDLAIPVSSKISENIGLPYFVSYHTAETCNNKDKMRQALGKDFEGNLNYQILEKDNDLIVLKEPFIIKPTDAQGQRGVNLITTNEDREREHSIKNARNYSRSGRIIAEQYIDGPEISVNGYLINGEVVMMIISDRETWPQYTGLIHKHVVPSKIVDQNMENKIYQIVKKACHKLEIKNGPVYLQMKIEKRPYIIEITPRLDGCHMWKLLKYYTGVDILKLTLQHLIEQNTSEIKNAKKELKEKYTLEFICQKPNSEADYSQYKITASNVLEDYHYYDQGEFVRPVNGKYDKIGYFIY